MRIAVISPPWAPVPPALYGGIELVVDRLSVGFQNAGHDVLLYATGDSTSPVPMQWVLEKSEGMRIGMAVPEQRHVMHAYEAVTAWGADVVHDHSIIGPFHAADRYPDLPVATTIHGPFNEELTDLYERLNKSTTPIIAISQRAEGIGADRGGGAGYSPRCRCGGLSRRRGRGRLLLVPRTHVAGQGPAPRHRKRPRPRACRC